MMTCRLVGFAPACWTMASVMARTSAFFCVGVRPVHICTVTTGMSWFPLQYYFDPLADTTPLACAHRYRCAAAKPASPDGLQSEPLGSVEIDSARRRRKIDNERRFRQAREHIFADHAGGYGREDEVETRRQLRQLVQRVRGRTCNISGCALLGITRRDMGVCS